MPYHIPVKIILEFLEIIDIYAGTSPVTKQFFFVIHAIFVKEIQRRGGRHTPFHHRCMFFHQLMHIRFHLIQKWLIDRHISIDRIVKSLSHRKMQDNLPDLLMSCHMIYRL